VLLQAWDPVAPGRPDANSTAKAISTDSFFPSGDRIAALVGMYGGFAAGFAMRPIGAVVLGRLGDRQTGRYSGVRRQHAEWPGGTAGGTASIHVLLASSEASYVTGQVYGAVGGRGGP